MTISQKVTEKMKLVLLLVVFVLFFIFSSSSDWGAVMPSRVQMPAPSPVVLAGGGLLGADEEPVQPHTSQLPAEKQQRNQPVAQHSQSDSSKPEQSVQCEDFHKSPLVNANKFVDVNLYKKADLVRNKETLQKTIFSEKKVFFFAGLEGSGHHLISNALTSYCRPSASTGMAECRSSTGLAKVIGKCSASWNFDKLRTEQGRSTFASQVNGELATTSKMLVLNSVRAVSNFYNAQSYPDCGKPRLNGPTPDFRLLAEIAEEQGWDFRVVLLHRSSPDGYLISITHKRHFASTFDDNILTGHQNLELIDAQFHSVDRKFVSGCIQIDSPKESVSQACNVIDREMGFDVFTKYVLTIHKYSKKPRCIATSNYTPELMQMLRGSFEKLEGICDTFR